MSDYQILKKLKLIVFRPEGTLNAAMITSFINALLNDPDYRENYAEYVDLSLVQRWDIQLEEFRAIFNREISKNSKRKIINKLSIWAPTDIAFGVSRMFYSVANFHLMKIYIERTEEKALDNLKVTKSAIEQYFKDNPHPVMHKTKSTSGR